MFKLQVRTDSPLWIGTGLFSGAVVICLSYSDQSSFVLPVVFLFATSMMIYTGVTEPTSLPQAALLVPAVTLPSAVAMIYECFFHDDGVSWAGRLLSIFAVVLAIAATTYSAGRRAASDR